DQNTIVIASDSRSLLAILTSALHNAWAWAMTTSLGDTFRYNPSLCFQTYPFPCPVENLGAKPALQSIGLSCDTRRREIMFARQEGLTSIYNRFHDPDETSNDIKMLRELHIEMDKAVADTYGWADLHLCHSFHGTKQGLRYTISEPARREVLARLLKL